MPEPKDNKPLSLRDQQKLIYLRCASDPIYFIKTFCYIQANDGRMLFDLYEFQMKLTNLFRKHKRISIVKSRQLGITTICAAYALWLMLFHGDRKIICLAPTEAKARFIVDKVAFAYDNLPSWLKGGSGATTEKQKLSIVLKNGSSIRAVSGDSDSARGFTAHLLLVDEAAFIENAEDLWASSQSTLNETNGTAIVLSTPMGIGNWFHRNHVKGENGENAFIPIKLPWTMHPNRDQRWRDEAVKEFNGNERLTRQEYDAEFISSGNTVILADTIEWYKTNTQAEPVAKEGALQDFWIWKYPELGHKYVIVADVSRGDGLDYSTMQIFDLVSSEQVAEFNGQPDTKEFPNLLMEKAFKYNTALLIIERESIGWAVVKDVLEGRYPNLYRSPKQGMVMDAETYLNKNFDNDMEKTVPGFSTNVGVRPLVINNLIGIIERKDVILHSKRTIDQLRTFIYNKNNKATAAQGFNDDLILPIGIYEFLRDTAFRFSEVSTDLTKACLENMRMGTTYKTQPKLETYTNTVQRPPDPRLKQVPRYGPGAGRNPWTIPVKGGKDMDLRWLI